MADTKQALALHLADLDTQSQLPVQDREGDVAEQAAQREQLDQLKSAARRVVQLAAGPRQQVSGHSPVRAEARALVGEARRIHYVNDGFIKQLASELDMALRQVDHYYAAAVAAEREVVQTLAPALGYPEYEPGDPGYSPEQTEYNIGAHTAASLAAEAAARLREQG